ncbi:hypothetical protein ABGV42_00010 [Paenibacillus pabuli]|uniref:hypothetical protein n=1 Tax=Paenibacillus pabuli TaxID=1472 RepID=UPI0032421ED7
MLTQVWVDIQHDEGYSENMFIGEVDMRQDLTNIVDFALFKASQIIDSHDLKVAKLKYYNNDRLIELGSPNNHY